MYLFADATETKFFINNHLGLGLHRIEVTTVSDILHKYKICKPLALLGCHWLTGGYFAPLRVTGEPKSKPFKFDFLKYLSYAEITSEILDTLSFNEQLSLITRLAKMEACDCASDNNTDTLIDKKFAWSNYNKALNVVINHKDQIMSYEVVDNLNLTNHASVTNYDEA